MSLPDDIQQWQDRLSEPRAEFNGHAPCPFAKTAKVISLPCRGIEEARNYLLCLQIHSVLLLDMPLDLADECQELVNSLNPDLKERGLWALISDPFNPVVVQGYRTTQSKHLFIIVQPYDELQKAASHLESKGYYRNWDGETLERVRGSR